jgi:hypothetical protein
VLPGLLQIMFQLVLELMSRRRLVLQNWVKTQANLLSPINLLLLTG